MAWFATVAHADGSSRAWRPSPARRAAAGPVPAASAARSEPKASGGGGAGYAGAVPASIMKAREMFVDEVTISVLAGDGGDGCVHLHREKFVPRGGPDGGDGGRGGDVVVIADRNLATLLEQRMRSQNRAESGAPGEANGRNGRDGAALEIRVPVGTMRLRAPRRRRAPDRRPEGARRPLRGGARRPRRARQPALRHAHAPDAGFRRAGPGRRSARAAPLAQAARRRRAGRLPERGQVDAAAPSLRRPPARGGLSVHDAGPAARGRGARRAPLRGRRHPGPDRGRQRRRRPGRPFPASHRAHARDRAPARRGSGARGARAARGLRHDPGRARRLPAAPARAQRDRGAQQDRPAGRARARWTRSRASCGAAEAGSCARRAPPARGSPSCCARWRRRWRPPMRRRPAGAHDAPRLPAQPRRAPGASW